MPIPNTIRFSLGTIAPASSCTLRNVRLKSTSGKMKNAGPENRAGVVALQPTSLCFSHPDVAALIRATAIPYLSRRLAGAEVSGAFA